jgi:hypothetical protein
MVKLIGMAQQSSLDLAQARRPGQLAKQYGEKLGFAVQTPHTMVCTVLVHKTIKNRPGNVFLKTVKNAIVMPHGIDLHSCPKRRETS